MKCTFYRFSTFVHLFAIDNEYTIFCSLSMTLFIIKEKLPEIMLFQFSRFDFRFCCELSYWNDFELIKPKKCFTEKRKIAIEALNRSINSWPIKKKADPFSKNCTYTEVCIDEYYNPAKARLAVEKVETILSYIVCWGRGTCRSFL